MKASCSMWSLDRSINSENLSQVDFLKWARGQNLKWVELVSYYMDRENNIDEIIQVLADLDLQVSCYTILANLSVPGTAAGDSFGNDLNHAAALKAPYVRILAGGSSSDNVEERGVIVREIKQACGAAEKLGITLLIENVGPHTCASKDSLALLKSVDDPGLRMNFDTANPLLADEDPIEALENLADFISYVHFKDFVTEDSPRFEQIIQRDPDRKQVSAGGKALTGIVCGDGVIPLQDMIARLKAMGYDGFVSLEYEGTGDGKADSAQSLRHLDSLIRGD